MGSHYHFIEANKYLQFDRAASYGMRLVLLSLCFIDKIDSFFCILYSLFTMILPMSDKRSLFYFVFHHQNIAAGTAVRFEPGDTKTVELVDIAGNR